MIARQRISFIPRQFPGVHANFLSQSLLDNGFDLDALTGIGGDVELKGVSDEARVWKTVWSAGQGVGAINDVPSTAELCNRLRVEYLEAVNELSSKAEAYK